jgi:hypothetical protein
MGSINNVLLTAKHTSKAISAFEPSTVEFEVAGESESEK